MRRPLDRPDGRGPAAHGVVLSSTGPIDAGATAFNGLTVGNGEIGFTADVTGLQTFNSSYHLPQYPLPPMILSAFALV